MASRKLGEPLIPRLEAVALLAREYGIILGPRGLNTQPVPFVRIAHRALYRPADVRAYAERMLAETPRRTGTPTKPRRLVPSARGEGVAA